MLQKFPETRASTGKFIVFEGGDGAGKSTQLQLLAQALRERGETVVVTREPGGTELGAEIRRLLLHGGDVATEAEALLYAADRAHHIATVVRPALEAGSIVLQDRYIDSSLAYQGAARALGTDDIAALSNWATQGLVPDLTVLLDLPVDVSIERRTARGETADRMEREALDFHERVRQGFLACAHRSPDRYLILDAQQLVATLHSQIADRALTLR